MTGMLRVPRSRGALSGILLVLLGAWGGLVPFVGPSFHYAYTPDTNWTYTSGRLWLEILPGAAALLGGLIVLTSRNRPVAIFGAWLAALSGAWFALGSVLSTLWTTGGASSAGTPVGGPTARVLEQVGFFTGLGAAIVFLAALALGRFTVFGVREAKLAEREAEAAAEAARTPAKTAAAPASTTQTATAPARTSQAAQTQASTTQPAAAPAGTSDPAEIPARSDRTAEGPARTALTAETPTTTAEADSAPVPAGATPERPNVNT
jgi:hypothetical protein